MSFGGSFQTGPDSLYAGADLVRKNEQENLRMAELRRMEEARKQLAADELLNQNVPDVRASWSSGMTDVVNAPAQVKPAVQPPLNLPPCTGDRDTINIRIIYTRGSPYTSKVNSVQSFF